MAGKLNEVMAATRVVAQSRNRQDEMFLVNFNERVFSGLIGRGRFTSSSTELETAIARAPADGKTALYGAIATGLEQLKLRHWDKKVLVLVSDGGDNASTHTLAGIIRMAEQSSAVIYTVGMFTETDADANPRSTGLPAELSSPRL
jgi:Mg-chelatase subunit ChlD